MYEKNFKYKYGIWVGEFGEKEVDILAV